MPKLKILEYIEGNNIFIQKISLKDADDFYAQLRDPEVYRYLLIDPPLSLKEEKKFIRRARDKWKEQSEFTFTIKLKKESLLNNKKENLVCGVISLWNINHIHNFGEIGIWIKKNSWGTGINYEAIQLILLFGFEIIKLNRIEAKISSENIRSSKTFERMNFKLDGSLRKKYKIRGVLHDTLLYSMLKKEYKK